MLHHENVTLRKAEQHELRDLHQLITHDEEWTKYNGPYFPYKTPTEAEFEQRLFKRLCAGKGMLLIEIDGRVVGTVSYYWQDENTRWLEAGIVIYDSSCWGQQIGRKALTPWVTHLFNTLEIERVGLTTWSGNPRMMKLAENLGFKREAQLRKVRYHQGTYYDSVKFGILRTEWFDLGQR